VEWIHQKMEIVICLQTISYGSIHYYVHFLIYSTLNLFTRLIHFGTPCYFKQHMICMGTWVSILICYNALYLWKYLPRVTLRLWEFIDNELMGQRWPIGWKHSKVEYIILSQLVELSIMGHGTKYKWIICENDSKR
jgi:hypothetical protein